MTPLAQLEALVATFSDAPLGLLIEELHNPTPHSELRRLAAAQALSRRRFLPSSAIDSLTAALHDPGAVNMEPWITPDPYMTPPEAIHHESVQAAALAALIAQGHAALGSVCRGFCRRSVYGYQLLRFLSGIGGTALLTTPKDELAACQACILSQRADHDGQRAITILAWANAHQTDTDSLRAQLTCPMGTVRADAAEALARRDGESALPDLLSAAHTHDAESLCGVIRALHSVITTHTTLDDESLNTLTQLASVSAATAELTKVCAILGVLGPRAQSATAALRKLATRPPTDIYDYHSRAVSQAATCALRAIEEAASLPAR
ncbi:MAG: hypothetical protein JNM40_25825 [Myxococcales bacterium]|nr:hypothetical protein [Myxococcales bacterium]